MRGFVFALAAFALASSADAQSSVKTAPKAGNSFAVDQQVAATKQGSPFGQTFAVFSPQTKPGSWADYAITDGVASASLRWTYLGPLQAGHAFEVEMAGAKLPTSVARLVVELDASGALGRIKETIVQAGPGKPVRMPDNWTRDQPGFSSPDPKGLAGKEMVAVGQRMIEAARYRTKTPQGLVDLWVSEEATPIGVVRMVLTPQAKAAPSLRPLTLSLLATGADAKPKISAEAVPLK